MSWALPAPFSGPLSASLAGRTLWVDQDRWVKASLLHAYPLDWPRCHLARARRTVVVRRLEGSELESVAAGLVEDSSFAGRWWEVVRSIAVAAEAVLLDFSKVPEGYRNLCRTLASRWSY